MGGVPEGRARLREQVETKEVSGMKDPEEEAVVGTVIVS